MAVSLLVHCVVVLVVALGVTYSHTDIAKRKERRYPVHFIRLQLFDPVPNRVSVAAAEQPAVSRASRPLRLHRVQAKQTLIRPDVPPDVVLKQEIPMAAVLPETGNAPAAVPEFVPRPNAAPALTAPLQSRLRLDATQADLISIPNIPLRAQDLLVVPPANQIAAGDVGAPSATSAGAPSGREMHGSGRPADAAGLVRITQPKDGKFGIVVSGSSISDEFPESAGILSGQMVYTVYLKAGLRKNWVLQYCLPKDAEPSEAAVDAPWPFLMLRPDPLSTADLDYIVVRGIVNCNGRFEQLGLVYPNALSGQEKLLGALRQWTFRPASRDGRPVAVEVLLVIPMQQA